MLIDKTIERDIRVHQVFIIDESSSMDSLKREVKDGFQSMIESLKETEKGLSKVQTFISVLTFSSNTTIHCCDVPIKEFSQEIPYKPNGMTALFDAIFYANRKISGVVEASSPKVDHKVILNIYTDGEENCSQECLDGSSLISEIKNKGWIVNLFGTNEGALSGKALGITNTVRFNPTPQDTMRSYRMAGASASAFSKNLEKGISANAADYLIDNSKATE